MSLIQGNIEEDYDDLLSLYRKNGVSCYTLNLIIKSFQSAKDNDKSASSMTYYTTSQKDRLLCKNKMYEQEIIDLKDRLHQREKSLTIYKIILFPLLLFTLILLGIVVSQKY